MAHSRLGVRLEIKNLVIVYREGLNVILCAFRANSQLPLHAITRHRDVQRFAALSGAKGSLSFRVGAMSRREGHKCPKIGAIEAEGIVHRLPIRPAECRRG